MSIVSQIKSIRVVAALILGMFFLPISTSAATTAGTIIAFKGEVTATDSQGTLRSLVNSDSISVGDVVRTGVGSYVVIEFIDGAKATIRPESEIVIDRYAFGTEDDGALMNLVKGGLRAVTGQIAKKEPESYKIKTNIATLGVRGTEFAIRICDDDCEA